MKTMIEGKEIKKASYYGCVGCIILNLKNLIISVLVRF